MIRFIDRSRARKLGFLKGVLRKETAAGLEAAELLAKMRVDGVNALRPRMVICETINVCNSYCVFCPYSKQTRTMGLMSMDLFRKVVTDYQDMGGGHLSLTPMVGDLLLDRYLEERVKVLKDFRDSISLSVTTNLYSLDRWSDEVVRAVLDRFARIHVSIYGIDEEETEALTLKKNFPKLVPSLKRLTRLWEEGPRSCEIKFVIRSTRDLPKEKLDEFLLRSCGRLFPYTFSFRYANWGNSMSGRLPGDAQYLADQENSTTCALLLVALQVYWDGRVSTCACCDYDVCEDLYVGSMEEKSLLELFNSDRNKRIWLQHETGDLPGICKKCTFFYPLSNVGKDHPINVKITDFIGG